MTTIHHALDVERKFGDWGPGYLFTGSNASYGIVTLRPGDAFANHLHEAHEETFFVLEGTIEIWLDRNERLMLSAEDLVRCEPGVEHFLRNTSDRNARALFLKVPGIEGDKIEKPWVPEDTKIEEEENEG